MHRLLLGAMLLCSVRLEAEERLTKQTVDAWTNYIELTEKRIDKELQNTSAFQGSDVDNLKSGKIHIQRMTTKNPAGKPIEIPDGAVHDWRGATFVPGVTLDKLIAWMQNYPQYQDYFRDIEQSSFTRPPAGDTFDIFLHLTRTKLGITAHFNTRHNVAFVRRSRTFVSSVSRSTQILELKNAGTPEQRESPEGEDSGYLWRLNTYWRLFETNAGVVVECEAIALSSALGWRYDMVTVFTAGLVNPSKIADSIARDALENTLTDLGNGIQGGPRKQARR
jgi:hypothetical protein